MGPRRLDLLPQAGQLGAAAVDVAAVVAHLLAPLGQPDDLGLMAQQAGVGLDRCQQRRPLGCLRGMQLLLAPGSGQGEFSFAQLARRVGRQQQHGGVIGCTGPCRRSGRVGRICWPGRPGRFGKRSQLGLQLMPLAQRRQHPAHPLELNPAGVQAVLAGAQLLAPRLQRAQPGIGVNPVLGAHGARLQSRLGHRQRIAGDVVGPAAGLARRPQRISLCSQLLTHRAQAADAGGRLEQDLADVVLGTEQGLAAGFEPAMVQAEHLVEKRPVGATQPGGQGRLGQRLAVGVEQGAVARLGAYKGQLGAGLLDAGAQLQVGLGMHKVKARTGLDAVEQVKDGAAGGGLAGLVGADDEVEVSGRGGEVQAAAAELAVGEQVELLEAHRGSGSL